MLLTTQYLDEADQLADRIAVIDRGVKVAEGTSDQLKSSVGRSTLQLQLVDGVDLGTASDLARRLVDDEPVPTPESRRLNVPLRHGDQAVDVLLALRQAGIEVESLTVPKPSRDEVFLALTGHDTHEPAAGQDTTAQNPADREMESVR